MRGPLGVDCAACVLPNHPNDEPPQTPACVRAFRSGATFRSWQQTHSRTHARTHAHDRLQAARTKIHSREEKTQGTLGLLSARVAPPSKNMRASALRSAFFTSNQIPFGARHSSFISRMCFWSSTNMSQCDTARRFTQRPSQLTCPRQSFAFFGRRFVLIEVPVLSPLFALHHASGGPSWKNRPPRMCERRITHPAGVSPHQGGLKIERRSISQESVCGSQCQLAPRCAGGRADTEGQEVGAASGSSQGGEMTGAQPPQKKTLSTPGGNREAVARRHRRQNSGGS